MPLELGTPVRKRSPHLSALQQPWKAQVLCKYLQLWMQWGCCFTLLQIASPAKDACGEETSFFGTTCMCQIELYAML